MTQLQDPPRFKVLNRGELVDTGTQPEERSPVTTRMDASPQVSESQLDSSGCDPGDGDTLDDDQGGIFVDAPPEWTTEFEERQGSETLAEVHPEQDTSGPSPEPASWAPLEKLEMEYERCMRVSAEDLDLEPGVYIHEGSEMLVQLRDQLVMLPELSELYPECDIDQADVGVPGETSPEDESRMRAILKRHRKIFLGDVNATPAPARGVVCDLDMGDAKPIALRPRSIGPHVAVKVYELLKKLLEDNLVEHSESRWASPVVIVLKKNGVDIRMCIDYRLVNNFMRLSSFPLPLIDDLLVCFEKALWFMSLDMANVDPNAVWPEKRTPDLSASDQQLLVGIRASATRRGGEVDQEVLDYLNLDPQDDEPPGCGTPGCTGCEDDHVSRSLPTLADQMTVFKRNTPAPTQMSPVLGRSSYIDDIAHAAPTWDALCADLDALLYRLRYWNISVSLPKSEFGKLSIPYLSHEISAEGIRATPKIAKGVQDLPFPTTLKGVKFFLGSLNYYHKFIEDDPVVEASLYELSDDQVRSGRDLSRAKQAFDAFKILKYKIVSIPVLRHPDRTKPFVIIPHANQWAACAALGQEHDGLIQPMRFTGRVLHDAKLRYHIAEKEVIAVLRALGFEVDHEIQDSRWQMCTLGRFTFAVDLDVRKIQRDEDGLAAILGAGITLREHLDEVAEELIPAKGRAKPPPIISVEIEMLEDTFQGIILSFDGAAKTSTRQDSCGCILWKLPGWKILDAQGFILEDVTVNDAEYCGLLNGLTMAQARRARYLIAVGDSRIVIQQVQGLINCNQPNLQRRLASCEALTAKFDSVRLVHVKRDFNQRIT
ncbi:reverse transcriptase [Phytophthora megakarya]|uniref:Reverse transcriptase n=1 Tax=Phytophthora megakarya TaxID=4795 RepID=A0A225V8Y0_9STRA|nr:reverse transcriptase [Phytophthora megakarya]